MTYRRSQSTRSICRHVRLEAIGLESRLAPTLVTPIIVPTPMMVTAAPAPPGVAPPSCSPAPSNVRTDLFGHAAPTDEVAEGEADAVWGDLNDIQ